MEFAALKHYIMDKPATSETYPFGENVHVFKVNNKMFALVSWRNDLMMLNLKCDPDESASLREIFSSITEGYYMDKKHWISIYFDNTVPTGEIKRLTDNSFMLVVNKMPKKDQKWILLNKM